MSDSSDLIGTAVGLVVLGAVAKSVMGKPRRRKRYNSKSNLLRRRLI